MTIQLKSLKLQILIFPKNSAGVKRCLSVSALFKTKVTVGLAGLSPQLAWFLIDSVSTQMAQSMYVSQLKKWLTAITRTMDAWADI